MMVTRVKYLLSTCAAAMPAMPQPITSACCDGSGGASSMLAVTLG
jgi:hypothetical protein